MRNSLKKTNRLISILLTAVILIATVSASAYASTPDTVILYTNDVNCAIDDFPILAAYRAELIAQGKNVIVVDAGDAIQGEVIGSTTDGEGRIRIVDVDPVSVCEHMCHNEFFLVRFVWRIVNYIFRIIDIQQYCDCGITHY